MTYQQSSPKQPSSQQSPSQQPASNRFRNRIIIGFSSFAILISVLFGFYNLLFAYVIEDAFFERMMKEEARYLAQQYESHGKLVAPRQTFMQAYDSLASANPELKQLYQAEPGQLEYAGADGRHYHLVFSQQPKFLLVGEVSAHLVVRPVKEGLLIILMISAVLMLILACGVGYWLASKATRPLSRLASLVAQAGPTTLPGGFADDFGNDEIGILARSLESSMHRIKTFIDREQHFTRDASHELRTPVAIIKGAAELLSQGELTVRDRELLKRIEDAVLQMDQSVSTLLLLAREESTPVAPLPVAVLPLIEQSIIQHAYLLENKPVEVSVEVSPAAKVAATPGGLQILVANLISNAFQYTSQGEVRIELEGSQFQICNSGEGIDPSIKGLECDPMIKGRESKGFGIGLSIVKRLCERNHWTLTIHSDDQGTRISVDFNPECSLPSTQMESVV